MNIVETYDKGHTHLGKDKGAIAKTGQTEGKTAHNIVMRMEQLAQKRGVYPNIINRSGGDCSINNRVNEAAKYTKGLAKHNISVSVHLNASVSGKGKGNEVFAEHNDKYSLKLAEFIVTELDKLNEHRGVKTRPSQINPSKSALGMLNIPNSTNVLVECAFIDSETNEVDTLTEQWQYAEAIDRGIQNYREWVKNN